VNYANRIIETLGVYLDVVVIIGYQNVVNKGCTGQILLAIEIAINFAAIAQVYGGI